MKPYGSTLFLVLLFAFVLMPSAESHTYPPQTYNPKGPPGPVVEHPENCLDGCGWVPVGCWPYCHKQGDDVKMGRRGGALSTVTNIAAAKNTNTAVGRTSSAVDSEALLAFKSMIKDDPQGLMSSWNHSINICQWQGVTCSPHHQRVTVLDLSSGGLLGSLSPFIGNLSFLRAMRLQNNSLSGEILPEVGRLFRLQQLYLGNNSFQGNIPTTLSNCSKLQFLHLGYNNLVGKIPDGIGSLSMLNVLIIQRNNLEGGIPPFIRNLTSLETLSLGDCGLGGSIPDLFHHLNKLRRISLLGNNLVGTIPPSLYSISSLAYVVLDNNRLTGTLPVNLYSMQPHLQALSLFNNQFTGPLPPILSSSDLRVLDVARNNFSGELVIISGKACNLTVVSLSSNNFGSNGENDVKKFIDALSICRNLRVLDIGYNQMKGFLPESLGILSTTLNFLSLASNAFSGGLPSSVGDLSGLTSLDLSSNQLTGSIPEHIGNLQSLGKLDLKNNYFSGNIPDSLGNLSSLIELHLGLNELNGSIPSSLGNCKRMIWLTLDQNNLSGDIPRQLFKIPSLSISLNLGSNQLSGQLPAEVGNLKNLNEIILAKNSLSGDLPSSLGSCNSLQNLNLSTNFFRGSLPESLRSLRALQNLDVSHNNFTGEIPSYLEVIPLENLNISFNGFEGKVSTKGVFANARAVSLVGNSRLCDGIPELRLPKCSSTTPKTLHLAVILVISLASVMLCVAALLFFVFNRQKGEIEEDPSKPMFWESLIQVSFKKLYDATEGFSPKNLIGKGSFSSVYRGYLDKDGVLVAIKVLNLHRGGGFKSFISECEALRNARHRNLVKIITCCNDIDFQGNEFKAIVYEYMPNGSLDRWLHNVQIELPPLNLLQRVCIAMDVAYALDYLHYHAGKTIIHCDLKPSNILLDEDMVAHVGDFGLSKIFQSEYQNRQNSSSTRVRGTIGYAATEYGLGSKASRDGDMYSYGILLLEMITRKKPTDAMFKEGLCLHSYAKTAMIDGTLGIVDPVLLMNDDNGRHALRTNDEGVGEPTATGYMKNKMCLRLVLEIGVSCSMESPQYRMDTRSVIQELQLVKDTILGTPTVYWSSI